MGNLALKGLYARLNEILTANNSETSTEATKAFIAWCTPCLPFSKETLEFAGKNLKKEMTGDDTKDWLRTAYEFSSIVNTVPNLNAINTYETKGSKIWNLYEYVLDHSNVPADDLTDSEQTKLENYRKAMTVTIKKMVENEDGEDVEQEMEVDSPMVASYKKKKKAYESALLNFNAKRILAMYSEDTSIIMDFALNGSTYQGRVDEALDEWIGEGYKNEYERKIAFINNVGRRSMELYKEYLRKTLGRAKLTTLNNEDFYLTTFYPASFINNDDQWTKLKYDSAKMKESKSEDSSAVSGSAGIRWGFWSAEANTSYGDSSVKENSFEEHVDIELKVTQVILGRPWFEPDFLMNQAWKWSNEGEALLSDGASPFPAGRMPAYSTAAIFVKDVKITSSTIVKFYNEQKSRLEVGGSFGWGPFRFSASHKQEHSKKDSDCTVENNSIIIPGVQLMALKCFTLPKCPNPTVKF